MSMIAKAGESFWFVPVFLLFLALGVLNLVWFVRRSASLLERHLTEQGCRLVEREHRWFARGPFTWKTSKGQAVYRFTAEDGAGQRRQGWARVGGFIFGLFSARVDLRWDDKPRGVAGPGFPVVMPSERP